MTTLQALKILKTEFETLNIPQKDGSFKSLICLEDVLIQIIKELNPEVRRFLTTPTTKVRWLSLGSNRNRICPLIFFNAVILCILSIQI